MKFLIQASIIFASIYLLVSCDCTKEEEVSPISTIQTSTETIQRLDLDLDGYTDFNSFSIPTAKSHNGGSGTISSSHYPFTLFGINGTEILYKVEDDKKHALFSNKGDLISLNDEQNLWTTDTLLLYQRETSKVNDNPQVITETWHNTSYSSSKYMIFKLGNGQLGWAELGHTDKTQSIVPTIIRFKLSYDDNISIGL